VGKPANKSGLLMEDKISLMNRLSTFYHMSEFFFSLNEDIVRTANDRDINRIDLDASNKKEEQSKAAAEKIKEICDRLKLLEVENSDTINIANRKTLLRRKLLKLTKEIDKKL
jgi:hypothetical protein